jgi:hypothetical protein
MPNHRASDLLYESEAALRLVDDALHRLIDLPAATELDATDGDAPIDAAPRSDAPSTADAERREGLERALLLLGELDAGQGRAASR